jgi:hypothetical protein
MNIKIKSVTEIRAVYHPNEDMTFILKETTSAEGDPISTEVVGFYYGEPDEESTKHFIGKLKAEY